MNIQSHVIVSSTAESPGQRACPEFSGFWSFRSNFVSSEIMKGQVSVILHWSHTYVKSMSFEWCFILHYLHNTILIARSASK